MVFSTTVDFQVLQPKKIGRIRYNDANYCYYEYWVDTDAESLH